jgi:hypothetical protein
MKEGLFHLKRNVGAFIHAGSCYKIEGHRKYILQWREFSVWEQVPVTRLGTHITSSVYHVHFYLFN